MTVTATTETTAPIRPAAGTSTRQTDTDYQMFLKMLTAQATNQDPLNPIDSSDYATQLATFSGVEQQVKTNDLLTALAAQMGTSGMAQMAAWVGKEARAPVAAHFTGAPITIAPNPASSADKVELVVKDSTGAEVQRLPIAVSADTIEWAGVGANGTPLANGNYTFTVESSVGGEVILSEPADVYSTIQEVRSEGGQTILILSGGVAVSSTQVSALRDPALS
jgi:flagellar basal-body rod modification protein FlgD